MSVLAHEVLSDNLDKNVGEPGAYYFIYRDTQKIGIIHGCPCGCGGRSAIFFEGSNSNHAEWKVIGEWPNVTLTPSIGIKYDVNGNSPKNGYHWHGFLENGVFVEK